VNLAQIREEVLIELDNLETTVAEVEALRRDLAGREPTNREKTAAATFLAQFYSGVENILKRLSRFYAVPLPAGDTWHAELFKRFCKPSLPPLPELFDATLAARLAPFRKFRHVVFHGYGFQIDWERMQEGVAQVGPPLTTFKARVQEHLAQLGTNSP
jgi:hypothetical protein